MWPDSGCKYLYLSDMLGVTVSLSPTLLLLHDDPFLICRCHRDAFDGLVPLQPRTCWPWGGNIVTEWSGAWMHRAEIQGISLRENPAACAPSDPGTALRPVLVSDAPRPPLRSSLMGRQHQDSEARWVQCRDRSRWPRAPRGIFIFDRFSFLCLSWSTWDYW